MIALLVLAVAVSRLRAAVKRSRAEQRIGEALLRYVRAEIQVEEKKRRQAA
jgi:hypothetical protein